MSTRIQISELMKGIESLILNKEYDQALEKINEFEKLNYILSVKAHSYDFRYRIALETGGISKAINVAQKVIKDLAQYGYICSGEEHTLARHVVRESYNILALNTYQLAKDEKDIEQAIEFTLESFSSSFYELKGGEEDQANPFYETKALIYRKAKDYNSKYKKEYQKALRDIKNKKIDVKDDDLKKDIAALNNNSLIRVLFGAVGETIKEAMQRYCKAYEEFAGINADIENIKFKAPCSAEEIAETEAEIGFPLPESLKDFYQNEAGGVTSFKNMPFERFIIYSPDQICGYMDFIRCDWYDEREDATREEVLEWYEDYDFTEEDMVHVDFINENYKVIGIYYTDAESQKILFVGKNGKFGVYNFQQDIWGDIYGRDKILLDKEHPVLKYDDFDKFISRFVNMLIRIECYETERYSIDNAFTCTPVYELITQDAEL